MIARPKDFQLGDSIPTRSYHITKEIIEKYTIDAVGKITKNIHTDDETARKAGLPRAVAQSRYAMCYISETMIDLFGADWFLSGELAVALTRLIFPGDTATLGGRLQERRKDGARERLIFEVWLENQAGEKVIAGTASVAIAP
jgi:acyl dehydratase